MQDLRKPFKPSRRSVLISAVSSTAVLMGAARRANAGTKAPQSAVHYQSTPKDGQNCGHCNQFVAPNGCKFVDGEISPTGWCRLFVKRTA